MTDVKDQLTERSETHTPVVWTRERNTRNETKSCCLSSKCLMTHWWCWINNPPAPQDRTNNLFKQVYEQKSLKGRANDAIASACLYIACRQEGVPRTFKGQNTLCLIQIWDHYLREHCIIQKGSKWRGLFQFYHRCHEYLNILWTHPNLSSTEICAVSRISKKEIGRCFKLILKALETSVDLITTGDFMSRFCSNLGLPKQVQMAATFIARKAVELDLVPGRSPISVAAAAIYMASQASAEKKTQKGTIKRILQLSLIIPDSV